MKDIVEEYQKLNRSFRKTLIFHLGVDSGFFAEYTYMINAMLYCLQHKIQFKLYSADANFGYDKGWMDYFMPFCEEVTERFHQKHNIHTAPSWKRVLATCLQQKNARFVKWKLKSHVINLKATIIALTIYKRWTRLNHNVNFNPNQHFYVPELGIDGDYMHAFTKLAEITFRFNKQTTAECCKLIEALQLPPYYIGCQIRGGDKITETKLLPPQHYIQLMKDKIENQTVFVLTDDYTLFRRLQELSPKTQWFTLCSPEEKGYINSTFVQNTQQQKKVQIIRLMASMQILLNSGYFVGSITTGPSLFLLKVLYPAVLPADCALENLKSVIAIPVADRSKIMQEYITQLQLHAHE